MKHSRVEQRADMFENSLGERFNSAVVMQGMLPQREVNTVTAIETMQNRGISGAIIERVLAGADRRVAGMARRCCRRQNWCRGLSRPD